MSFFVGQKVVCVDDKSTGKYLPPGYVLRTGGDRSMDGLRKGKVYTIRSVDTQFGMPVCRLKEIERPIELLFGEEATYAQARFRPVTDIRIFTALLDGVKQGELA